MLGCALDDLDWLRLYRTPQFPHWQDECNQVAWRFAFDVGRLSALLASETAGT